MNGYYRARITTTRNIAAFLPDGPDNIALLPNKCPYIILIYNPGLEDMYV